MHTTAGNLKHLVPTTVANCLPCEWQLSVLIDTKGTHSLLLLVVAAVGRRQANCWLMTGGEGNSSLPPPHTTILSLCHFFDASSSSLSAERRTEIVNNSLGLSSITTGMMRVTSKSAHCVGSSLSFCVPCKNSSVHTAKTEKELDEAEGLYWASILADWIIKQIKMFTCSKTAALDGLCWSTAAESAMYELCAPIICFNLQCWMRRVFFFNNNQTWDRF